MELSKYSYLLAYIDSSENIFGNATGFLIKNNNLAYLCSNVHVLFGISVDDLTVYKDLIGYGNYKISLRYRDKSGTYHLFDTEIDKKRNFYKEFLFPKMLDLFIYPLPELPKNGEFNYINEDFEIESSEENKKIVALGYPFLDWLNEKNILKRICRTKSGSTIGNLTENGRRINTSLYVESGMSGCPIFSLSENNGQTIYKFIGIGDGFDPKTNHSFITRFYGSEPNRKIFTE
ncbi:hypothetical protein [Polaribacter gangjinensis]|uniref:Serine protease n=1 Tax=Polaribacter gangjinensis TaxID=574710 RepID=A0A2S7W8F5_9FLAO|nr:hypothetical protein [Polaribacter gangjinensis]PQJ73915.1 hypothetical protein BTO13_00855 [Polaribacter gangjinensis]